MTFEGDGCPPVKRKRTRRERALTIVLPTGVVLGAGAAIAVGQIPNSGGEIKVCFAPDRGVRFVDDGKACAEGEETVKINQKGPAGPAGAPGAPGAQGVPGPAGGGGIGVPVYPIPASDFLLEIDGIKGESKEQKHPGTIDIESFSWGLSQGGVKNSSRLASGGGAGKVVFSDISVSKSTDAASPLLFKSAATGKHIKKAVLYGRKAGGGQQEYLKITLEDCLISSFQQGPQAPGSGAGQLESFSLNFAKISYSYSPVGADGKAGSPLIATYDLKSLKK
jgi:type VI secretion system secreted protein Hcp